MTFVRIEAEDKVKINDSRECGTLMNKLGDRTSCRTLLSFFIRSIGKFIQDLEMRL